MESPWAELAIAAGVVLAVGFIVRLIVWATRPDNDPNDDEGTY